MKFLLNRFSTIVRILIAVTIGFSIFAVFSWFNPLRSKWVEGALFYLPVLIIGLLGNGGILFLIVRNVRSDRAAKSIVVYGSIIIGLAMIGAILSAATRVNYRWILNENTLQLPGIAFGLVVGYMRRKKKVDSSIDGTDTSIIGLRLTALILDLLFPGCIQVAISIIGPILIPERARIFILIGTATAYFLFILLRSRVNGSLGERRTKLRITNVKTGENASSWQRIIRSVLVLLWPIELFLFVLGSKRTIAERISGTKVNVVQ